jgi:phage antirepressor YoqD-like protein
MKTSTKIREVADAIARNHGGKQLLSLTEAAAALGLGKNHLPRLLNEHGVLVKKIGPRKLVAVVDLAEMMCSGMVSPLDNSHREGGQ